MLALMLGMAIYIDPHFYLYATLTFYRLAFICSIAFKSRSLKWTSSQLFRAIYNCHLEV